MKNLKTLLFFMVVTTLSYAQIKPIGGNTCGKCDDSNNEITVVDSNTFQALSAQAYWWEICAGNATIIGSNTSQNVDISCSIGETSTIKLTRFVNGNCIESCETFTCAGSGGCEASVKDIWCNKNNGPNSATYPTMINVEFYLTNPFPNSASGYARWNDDYLNGQQAAGGVFGNLAVGATNLIFPSQFYVNISEATTNWPSGFYVPLEVKYVDNVTGEICIVTLNPLVYGPCDVIGPQRNGVESTIKISPNPSKANSELKFEGMDVNDINSIEVLDLFGNSKMSIKPSKNSIKLRNLASGIYIIRFNTSKGIQLKKIIIE